MTIRRQADCIGQAIQYAIGFAGGWWCASDDLSRALAAGGIVFLLHIGLGTIWSTLTPTKDEI